MARIPTPGNPISTETPADPHPQDEGHPYDAPHPGGDAGPPSQTEEGRADLGVNPAVHDGKAPPRPNNRGSGPK